MSAERVQTTSEDDFLTSSGIAVDRRHVSEVMVEACRELGYVEVQAGRGAAAGRLLQKATVLAVALRHGDLAQAQRLLRHAFSLGCRLGDPCWEALAARAIGLVHDARDERGRALEGLRDAAASAVRVADPYLWSSRRSPAMRSTPAPTMLARRWKRSSVSPLGLATWAGVRAPHASEYSQ